ncbi:MAG: hypothetical protein FWD61_02455 [Phycisphaerales bacterium]|nr:hypothetical protein [Phycisphaerales bacterium]
MTAMTEQSQAIQTKRDRGLDTELKRRLVDHFDLIKRPNDLVRVTQISNHHFRVNTLSPIRASNSVLPAYQITKSQFLHVENKTGELVINDQTRR